MVLSGNACVWAAQKVPFHNGKEKGRVFLGRSVEGGGFSEDKEKI